MSVFDASVIVTALADFGRKGDRYRTRMSHDVLNAPDFVRLEVISALRRHYLSGRLSPIAAQHAIADLLELLLQTYEIEPMIFRVWELRNNITPYDACYVALAEALNTPLLTADRRLANAPGINCKVELISNSQFNTQPFRRR